MSGEPMGERPQERRTGRLSDWGFRIAVGFVLWVLCYVLAIAFLGTGIDTEELPTWQLALGSVFVAGELLIPMGGILLLVRGLLRRARRPRFVER